MSGLGKQKMQVHHPGSIMSQVQKGKKAQQSTDMAG